MIIVIEPAQRRWQGRDPTVGIFRDLFCKPHRPFR
jgi:hypothetical protein